MMVSLLGECCLHCPSSINLNRWKSESTKSRLYGGCSRTVQPKLAMCSMAFKLVWGLALLCCKRKVVFSGMTPEVQAFSLVSSVLLQSELMGSRESRKPTLFLFQKTMHITLPTEGYICNFFDEEFTCHYSKNCHFDSTCSGDTMSCRQ